MQFGINKNVSLVYLKFSYSHWVYLTVVILRVPIMDQICVDFMFFSEILTNYGQPRPPTTQTGNPRSVTFQYLLTDTLVDRNSILLCASC